MNNLRIKIALIAAIILLVISVSVNVFLVIKLSNQPTVQTTNNQQETDQSVVVPTTNDMLIVKYPITKSTTNPNYSHYKSAKGSVLAFEFDFPSDYVLEEFVESPKNFFNGDVRLVLFKGEVNVSISVRQYNDDIISGFIKGGDNLNEIIKYVNADQCNSVISGFTKSNLNGLTVSKAFARGDCMSPGVDNSHFQINNIANAISLGDDYYLTFTGQDLNEVSSMFDVVTNSLKVNR